MLSPHKRDGNQAPKTLTSPVLRFGIPTPTAQFPPSRKIFGQNRNRGAHISALGSKSRPGTGDFDDTPPALHPPFIGASEGRWCALDAAPWTRQLLAGVRSYLFDIVSVVVRWRRIGKLAPQCRNRSRLHDVRVLVCGVYRNPLQIEARKSLSFNGAFLP